jgi:hydrogenase maturation protease
VSAGAAGGGALVIGLGNPVRGDDRAGLEVARRVRERAPDAVRAIEVEREPSGLIDAWEGARLAIVVDAAAAASRPGAVHRLDASSRPLPPGLRPASTHALGLAETIELARALGRLPERLLVYAIEGERFEAGAAISPAVEAAIDGVVERVLADVGA